MLEAKGNLWTYPAQARIITTNGTIKKNGECVMGRGCAREAVVGVNNKCGSWPGLPSILGASVATDGNHVTFLGACVTPATGALYSFPVKHNWYERADIKLIKRSAAELVVQAGLSGWTKLVLPRPGCGNGGLRWEDVRPILEPILDDRFTVISF